MEEGSDYPAVLIVEDEPLLRAEILDGLRAFGFVVHGAGDAGQALEILSGQGGIGAMVTDLMLPGMDGITLAERVREMPWPPAAMPDMILLTATLSAQDRQRAETAGIHLALEKPVRMKRLAEAVRSATERWTGRQPAKRA